MRYREGQLEEKRYTRIVRERERERGGGGEGGREGGGEGGVR